MRDQLIIRLSEHLQADVSWVRLSDANQHPLVATGLLEDAAKVMAGAQVIVLVPATDVLMLSAKVPTQNKQRLLKAIPYVVEEELASDVDLLHFSLGKADSEGLLPLAAVERHLMDAWQESLKAAGISADIMVSELQVLPTIDESWSLLLEGNTALLRGDNVEGFIADVENLGVVLPLVLKEREAFLPEKILVWKDGDNRGISPMFPEEISVSQEQAEGGLLSLIAEQSLNLEKTINLLQGDYSRREQLGKLWRPWRYAASLAGVLFVLQLGLSVSESSKLETQHTALKAEAKAIFKKTFPKIKRIVNLKVQTQQELKKLQSGGKTKKVNFLNLMADSGAAFKQTSGLVLRSIRYKNGSLDVELEVPNLQVLDQLKRKISEKKGLSVEIQSAASRKNIVQGRLQIKGTAS